MKGEPVAPGGASATEPASLGLTGGRGQIHLTGFMGSGKSTVGRLLARRLLWSFLDLDGVIERREGRPLARIFAEDGEVAFRAIEAAVLRQVVLKPRTVVALGGGTLIDEGNREVSAAAAVVVWLRAPLEILQARCTEAGALSASGPAEEAERRPLWGDTDHLRARLAERLPGYQTATITVDAEPAPDSVAEAVLGALRAAE